MEHVGFLDFVLPPPAAGLRAPREHSSPCSEAERRVTPPPAPAVVSRSTDPRVVLVAWPGPKPRVDFVVAYCLIAATSGSYAESLSAACQGRVLTVARESSWARPARSRQVQALVSRLRSKPEECGARSIEPCRGLGLRSAHEVRGLIRGNGLEMETGSGAWAWRWGRAAGHLGVSGWTGWMRETMARQTWLVGSRNQGERLALRATKDSEYLRIKSQPRTFKGILGSTEPWAAPGPVHVTAGRWVGGTGPVCEANRAQPLGGDLAEAAQGSAFLRGTWTGSAERRLDQGHQAGAAAHVAGQLGAAQGSRVLLFPSCSRPAAHGPGARVVLGLW